MKKSTDRVFQDTDNDFLKALADNPRTGKWDHTKSTNPVTGKREQGRWGAKQQWENLGQLHTSQELANIRETAKTEHQKTSITTLTYFGFYSVPFHAAPWPQPSVPCSTLCSLCLHSSVCLEQTQSLPLLTSSSCPPAPSESRFLSNHLISQAHSPSYSSQGLFKPLPFCETSALFLHFLRS